MRNTTNFFDRFYLIFLYLLFTLMGYNPIVSKCLYLSMILVLGSLIVKAYKKRNICLFVAFLYMLPYTSVLYYSLWGTQVQLSYYTQFNTQRAFFEASMIHFLFLITLNFFIKIPFGSDRFNCYRCNKLIFVLGVVGCVYATFFGKTGDINVFHSGDYSPDFTRSSLFEYFFVFYLISFVFSFNRKKYKYILYFLAAFYVAKNTLYGGRIESLMCVLFLLVVDLQTKIKFKFLLLGIVCGYVLMSIIGLIRAYGFSWDFIAENLFSKTDVITTQESDVNYSSVRILEMVRLNFITTAQRFHSFALFIMSIFISKDSLPKLVDLSTYNQTIYPCGGGGLISAFFYVFLGHIGVIFIGYVIAKILSFGVRSKNTFKNLFFVLAYTTMPRWFAYYPITLFKLALLGSIITYVLIKMCDYGKNKGFFVSSHL